MRNWKTPLDRHLKCAFQITHRDVIWRTQGPKYCLSNLIKNAHLQLKFKIRTLPSCENSQSDLLFAPCELNPVNAKLFLNKDT